MTTRHWLAIGIGTLLSFAAAAQDLTLTRLDCGNGANDPRRFSDTFAYTETSKPFTFSCYVIRRGTEVMVWDTGYLPGSVGVLRRVTETRDTNYQGREVAINIGGTNKLILQQELEITLIPDANIRAVFFFDAGNSWAGTWPKTEPSILADYGWGLRWYSPIGPLRFEWGYPLVNIDTSPDDPAFNFIIAPTF